MFFNLYSFVVAPTFVSLGMHAFWRSTFPFAIPVLAPQEHWQFGWQLTGNDCESSALALNTRYSEILPVILRRFQARSTQRDHDNLKERFLWWHGDRDALLLHNLESQT